MTIGPRVLGGKQCIRGTRIVVSDIFGCCFLPLPLPGWILLGVWAA